LSLPETDLGRRSPVGNGHHATVWQGLRVDRDDLEALTGADFEVAQGIYHTKRTCTFLTELAAELDL